MSSHKLTQIQMKTLDQISNQTAKHQQVFKLLTGLVSDNECTWTSMNKH